LNIFCVSAPDKDGEKMGCEAHLTDHHMTTNQKLCPMTLIRLFSPSLSGAFLSLEQFLLFESSFLIFF